MDLIGRFTPKTLAAAVALAVSAIAANANAAGLGRLTVQSALGQPLRAEVEITSLSKDEAASLTAKLAPPEAFKQAGLEYNPALTGLSFTIGQRADGRPVVKVTSNRPVNEPFVDLLVELNWSAGKFVREYTFLLDPPELRIARPSGAETVAGAAVVAPAVQSPSAQVTATPAPQAPAPAPVAPAPQAAAPQAAAPETPAPRAEAPASSAKTAPAKEPVMAKAAKGKKGAKAAPAAEPATAESVTSSSPAAPAGSLTTRRGDTLASIAANNRPSGVSLDQAIIAIYRANPSAFFGSINRMRADSVLTIPEGSEMAALSAPEARKQVRDSGEFRSYRTRLAASSRKLTTAKASQSASGAVAAPEAPTPAGPSVRDELKLSKGAPSAKAGAGGAGSKSASLEASVARDNALKESSGRVNELQKNVKDLEKLLELKNKRLAEVEKQLADAKSAGKTAVGSVTPPPVVPAKPDTSKADAAKAEATAKAEAAKAEATAKAEAAKLAAEKLAAEKVDAAKLAAAKAELPKLDVPKAELPKADAPKMDSPKDVVAGATPPMVPVAPPASDMTAVSPPVVPAPGSATSSTAPKPVPAPTVGAKSSPSPSVPVAAESGILDSLTENPLISGGVIALLGLGGAYAWWRRRKKASSEEKFEDSLQAGEEFSANSLFGTTGGQQVDTSGLTAGAGNSHAATSMQHGQTSLSGPASTEVDPIAEAEVYIAYGREAQAEEILKEALKRQPERQAIRAKLLEIYAGRKEVAAFSSLAKEMHEMTGGQNEEWPKVLTQGLAIDPSNPLFSGDGPKSVGGAIGKTIAAVGAVGLGGAAVAANLGGNITKSTKDALASFESFGGNSNPSALEANTDVPAVDFDLQFDTGNGAGSMGLSKDTTVGLAGSRLSQASEVQKQQSVSDLSKALDGKIDLPSLDLDLKSKKAAPKVEPDALSDFDDFRLDLPALETLRGPEISVPKAEVVQDLSPIGLDLSPSTLMGNVTGDSAKWQEMATKLDLASAYQDIGDKDGARELLDEVIRGGDTAQQQKAKAMLSKIN
jgi:pilus assembly protein FimV